VNYGFAVANNQGAKAATSPLLLFLNSDTRVHPNTLDGAVAFMQQHPEAGVMGCRTLNSNGSLQATAFAFPGKVRIFAYVSGLNRFFKLSRFSNHSTLCTPDYVQGSFLIIKKEIFEKCGGFDELFFLYAEEIDLCLRVKASGLVIYYYPDISITHHGGGSGRNSLACLGHFIKSSIGLYQKYRPHQEEKKLRQVLKSALRLRFFLELVFSPLNFRARKKDIKSLWQDLLVENNEKHK
jgi:GT2 family glycosyltransferase